MKNKIIIIPIFVCIFFSTCSNPESDGKKAAEKLCDCEKEFSENQDKAAKKFIADFGNSDFKTRVKARDKSNELQNKAIEIHEKCVQKAQEFYTKLAGKYVGNYEKTTKFSYAFNAQNEFNRNETATLNPQLSQQINSLILSIIPSNPDLEKLKLDLVGKKIIKNGDNYHKTRQFQIESGEQIHTITIKSEAISNDNYTMEVYSELNGPVSIYEIEMTVNYFLGTNDDWTIELIHTKRFETKVTGKYNDCITHSFGNGGFFTNCLHLKNNCDIPLMVEGLLITEYSNEWLPFEEIVEGNNEASVASWGNPYYSGSVIDYKIQKIERP